uniref:NADH-ubiquinone oxidoreductase chain 5 n=1 Tax=Georissa bangueyensis TaxID=1882664 RepID=A0A1B2G3C0_9GAST|nr:NADH dehydrogenase subunit 5 [Georissa bangueyensis]
MTPKLSSIISITLFLFASIMFILWIYLIMIDKPMFFEWEILSMSSYSILVPFLLDSISTSFSMVVCFISACVMMFSTSYMKNDPFHSRFIFLVLFFILSMNILVFIPNMISMLLGWDGLGITSFTLVIYYQNMKSLSAGMTTALVNRIGDVLLLLSIMIAANQMNWNLTIFWENKFSNILILSFLVAAMTKSAQMPFSAWLPAAMAAPTPVSALVHSSTLVTAGIFILIRFYNFLSTWQFFNHFTLYCGTMTLLMAGISANYEFDMKKIIALSTLSQLGVMMLSLSIGTWALTLFHLYTHALFKALLFLCAGNIIHNSTNNQDLRLFGALHTQNPLTTSCLTTATLALCGTPFLSGFYSKDLILEICLSSLSSLTMLIITLFATGLTASYSARLALSTIYQEPMNHPMTSRTDEDWAITSPMMMLSFSAITSGAYMQTMTLNFQTLVILPLITKLMILTILMTSFWLSFNIWSNQKTPTPPTVFTTFNSTMWFLASITTQPNIYKIFFFSKTLTKSIDQGWMEVLGGQGAILTTSKLMKMNNTTQKNNLPLMMITSLLTMIMISIMQ